MVRGWLFLWGALLASSCSFGPQTLEDQAADELTRCMRGNGGVVASNVWFEIDDSRLIDWNATYPGQGGPADDVHNACIRQLIDTLGLEAQLP